MNLISDLGPSNMDYEVLGESKIRRESQQHRSDDFFRSTYAEGTNECKGLDYVDSSTSTNLPVLMSRNEEELCSENATFDNSGSTLFDRNRRRKSTRGEGRLRDLYRNKHLPFGDRKSNSASPGVYHKLQPTRLWDNSLGSLPRDKEKQDFRSAVAFLSWTTGIMHVSAKLFVFGVIAYAVISLACAVRHDLAIRIRQNSTELESRISDCLWQYTSNKCEPQTRVQFMNEQCISWEICMNQKPSQTLYLKATVEVLSQVINAFFENLTHRSLILGSGFFFVSLMLFIKGFSSPGHLYPETEAKIPLGEFYRRLRDEPMPRALFTEKNHPSEGLDIKKKK